MRFELIDFLKGIAMVSVIALHTFSFTQTNLPPWLLWLLSLSVPLFIVLMAFNFANSWEKNSKIKEYFQRRAKRYLPVFAITWLASLFIGLVFSLPLQFGERQLIGYFPLTGGGNYFIPMVFQFIIIFPLVYWLFKSFSRFSFIFFTATAVGFEAIAFFDLLPLASITFQYNLLRFFFFLWLGFALSKQRWLKKRFVLQPFNWLGKNSYHIFLGQIIFFSEFGKTIMGAT